LSDHPFGGAADQDIGDAAVGAHDDEIAFLFYNLFACGFKRTAIVHR
jgi:hypothetical protein